MIRRVAAGVVIALFWAGAGDAAAQGWREWLDKLSGPGPFDGPFVAVDALCYGARRDARDSVAAGQDARKPRELVLDWGCSGADPARTRAVIGLDIAWLSTYSNPLTYADNPSRDQQRIRLHTLTMTVDVIPASDGGAFANAWLEIGAGAGIAWFDGDLFGTTSKPILQPFRVTVKPLALAFRRDKKGWSRVFQLQLEGTVFPMGFDAADFGSTDEWKTGGELVSAFGVVFDFSELVRRR